MTFSRRGSKPPAPLPPEPIYENLKVNEIQNKFEAHQSPVPKVYKKRAPPQPTVPSVERPNSLVKKRPAPIPAPKQNDSGMINQIENRLKLNPVKEMQLISSRNKSTDVRAK